MVVVVPERLALPHPVLLEADWADRYAVNSPERAMPAIRAARLVLGEPPAWLRRLLELRNRLVAPFGLKPAEMKLGEADSVGAFPIISARGDQVVLGFNDKHLDFRIVVDVASAGEEGSRIAVTTLVNRHNAFGRLYILAITPFHRLIVRTVLGRLADPAVLSR
ncbi:MULTISPECIES: DUF2867 domain-containing protein [Alphaproteobacteria]|uniref:DUF2867 domain-containing protein n=2 Tax=Alphaproteobacteria TaxID=28211 RepID=A0A512HJX8_9HYPH|nr:MULTISPECIES: DUF2867 domain-containing protein [Alphaproteobacteria]GEO85752.1 hypothetical protein RNA01_26840 [Ciceribacter naphthalenivorans]GLR21888.1 hypothetical protein GCM10007920_16750 [Ciceribacter naphthalenivorans]GLT04744.1 hypothetical protein GCM10007926_16750 [Sphingomonas psychrolutea]